MMYIIAKKEDATHIFRLIFRWFSMVLLFATFALSFTATVMLEVLFPPAYYAAAPVIPIVAMSIMFYGVYTVFTVGIYVRRKTWLVFILTTLAALLNAGLNLVLIPRFQLIGAALSTLIAYGVLAFLCYGVNRRIYPLPFEIGFFTIALLIGVALYLGADLLAQRQPLYAACSIDICSLCLYGGCLLLLRMGLNWSSKKINPPLKGDFLS